MRRTSAGRDDRDKKRGGRKDRQPGDMKALKMQRALSSVSYGHRSAVKSRLGTIESFAEFPLLDVIQEAIPKEALRGLVDVSPTPIQRLAIPALMGVGDKKGRRGPAATEAAAVAAKGMKQYLLAAETGSGKTLAYLLPTIDAIKRAEAVETAQEARAKAKEEDKKKLNMFELTPPPLSSETAPSSARPRAIILLPTSELVDQVGSIFKRFSHTVKLRVAMISAAYTAKVIRNRLFSPGGVDVLVSTPHLLGSIAESDPNILSRVTHLVIDEADSLLDRSFSPLTSAVIDRATPSLKSLVLCSATIPRSLDVYLRNRFPDIIRLATPNLHAIPRRVQLGVVDIDKDPYRGNRDLACADAIWNIGRGGGGEDGTTAAGHETLADDAQEFVEDRTKRVIVFVNEREKAAELAVYLCTKGVDAVALNRDTAERGEDVLAEFTSAPGLTGSVLKGAPPTSLPVKVSAASRRTLANTKVLVMTDIGSRGIDTVAVRHVVLYDVPHTSIDFIHRLGRCGRMGRRGRGIVLVGKDDRKDVVREVREGMFRGSALI